MSRQEPDDVRQGKEGTPVLRVLIAALLLCVVAAAIMGAYAWMMPDQTLPDASVGAGQSTTSAAPPPAATAPAAGN